MAMRRCDCGIWFEYDALVKDDAVECPECGRILARRAAQAGAAEGLGRTLVILASLAAVVLVAGGVAGALALVGAEQPVPAVVCLLAGVLMGATLIVLALTVRAVGDALGRLEDRVP
jgi:uncharacterized integral membrane protein